MTPAEADRAIAVARARVRYLAWALMLFGGTSGAMAVVVTISLALHYRRAATAADALAWGLMLSAAGWTCVAGWSLFRLRHRWAAWVGCVAAAVPTSACCVLSTPLGLLAMVALADARVRAGYAAIVRRDAELAEDDA